MSTRYKLVLIGDTNVGKSALLSRFSEDKFTSNTPFAAAPAFKIYTIELDGKKIELQIWDLPGNERFQTINKSYCRGAKGIMLVYDITSENSFHNIQNWIRIINENAPKDVEKMVLGNKCDMEDYREVSKEHGEQLAIEHGIKFMETSAKTSINVEDAFFTLARDIEAKVPNLEPSEPSNCCFM